ncbi:MAG: fumarylacetoacetate hydrolase family protein [Pseudomonadota bacterium]|nr:fumarylacetoacetate hydrolase family protein [Pseudomonadota bacterium]
MDAKANNRNAQLLGEARIGAKHVPPIPDEDLPKTSKDGYAVQKALNNFLRKNFQGEFIGWKIGATTVAMQRYLGVTEPAYGRIMSGNLIQSGSTLTSDNFCNPGIECEIAVRLGRSSNGEKYTRESAADLIDCVVPAIEIVENRYGDFQDRNTPTLIADDFFHKACVLGPELAEWHLLDLAELIGTVRIDGKTIAEGPGSGIMGHPLEAVAWLANLLSTQNECLNEGDLVMTGSLTPVIWVDRYPCRAEISFHGLESVSLDLI